MQACRMKMRTQLAVYRGQARLEEHVGLPVAWKTFAIDIILASLVTICKENGMFQLQCLLVQ